MTHHHFLSEPSDFLKIMVLHTMGIIYLLMGSFHARLPSNL